MKFKIVIFGASGKTGRLLVDQALDRGHEVTAVVRDTAKFTAKHKNLKVVLGQVLDPASTNELIPGHDAVLSALAPTGGGSGQQLIYSDSARSVLPAMSKHGIKRYVCITNALLENDPALSFAFRYIFRPILLRRVVEDGHRLEAYLHENDDWCEWTTVRPAGLTDGPLTKNYKVSPRFIPAPKRSHPEISRADLAHFMLDVLESGEWIRATPTICS